MPDVPIHVGFIIDGNRRWAQAKGLKPYEGHEAGYHTIKDVLIYTLHQGVRYVSAYVFSTENWKRPKVEVDYLIRLFARILVDDVPIFLAEHVRVRVVGSRERLNKKLLQAIEFAEQSTIDQTGGELLLCLNYGGQQEIIDAVRQISRTGVPLDEISEEAIRAHLYAADVPDCDLIVRTGGDERISNFMLWRSAYSELLFLEKQWPDMTKDDVTAILDEYARRQRRFGG